MDNAGAKSRDILCKINEHQLDSHGIVKTFKGPRHKNIYDIVRLIPLNSTITFEVLRNGEKLTLTSKSISMPEQKLKGSSNLLKKEFIAFKGIIFQEIDAFILQTFIDYSPAKLKYYLDILSKDTKRVITTYINFNSIGEALDIAPGDIVSRVNGVNVNSLTELRDTINQSVDMKSSVIIDFESGALGVIEDSKRIKILTPQELAGEQNFINN